MDFDDDQPSKIVRTPGTYKFRVMEDIKLRTNSPLKVFSDIKSEEIDWLWYPYIPFGRLTMLGGDPGAGKSFITTALASTLSTGGALYGEEEGLRRPMVTLMLSAEDDPADTIKPRLENFKADQSKILVSTEDIILDCHGLEAIEDMIDDTHARLVIIDPIVAFLGPKIDMNRANEVRHVMKGLSRIARKKNVAIVIVRHNRKQAANSPAGKDIYSGMGSIDFTASVRSELAVVETRNGVKFLNHIKANSGKKGLSIHYEIISLEDGSGLLCWRKFAFPQSAGEPRAAKINTKFRNETKVKQWLFDLVRSEPDGVPSDDVFAKGMLMGYSASRINSIKKGIASSNRVGNVWMWKLCPEAKGALDTSVDTGL